mgnify:CR=1 FL=1
MRRVKVHNANALYTSGHTDSGTLAVHNLYRILAAALFATAASADEPVKL